MSDQDNRIVRLEEQMIEARKDIKDNASHIISIKKECMDKCSLVDQLFIKFSELDKKVQELPEFVRAVVKSMINETKLSIIAWVVTVIIGSTISTLSFWYMIDKDSKNEQQTIFKAHVDKKILELKNDLLENNIKKWYQDIH